MKRTLQTTALATLLLGAAATHAQSPSAVTIYGRVDLSVGQQADAPRNREVRNGSNSRIGFRGVEDMGGGLRAIFHLEHRFKADDGTLASPRFWEGKSIVGLEGSWGRLTLGREENPAYTFGQVVADPWATDTVANNASIISGRIGSTRYSNTVNYRLTAGDFGFGIQIAEAEGNEPASGGRADKRPYSLGAGWASGPWRIGAGFENPADRDDRWATLAASYDFGWARLGGFAGSGKNAEGQTVRGWLMSAIAPLDRAELRASYGVLKNKDLPVNDELDKQFSLGYHFALSRRTTLYADLVNERRDGMPGGARRTGYDAGIKHVF